MGKRLTLFLVVLVAVMLVGASAAMADATLTDMPPSSAHAGTTMPVITTLQPSSVVAGGGDLTLTVHGNYFRASAGIYGGSYVIWNGTLVTTHYESPTLLTATVPAANVATPGTVTVVVRNVTDGTSSNTVIFTITAPLPVITALEPSSVVAGSGDLALTVRGNNFQAPRAPHNGAEVHWGRVVLVAHFVSATMLTATVPARLLATPGTEQVSVNNIFDGTVSAGVTFTITAPLPTITSISPSSAVAGSGDLTLTVNGDHFVPDAPPIQGSRIVWNYQPVGTTVYVSATQLKTTIPAAKLTTPGTAQLYVVNTQGDWLSNTVTFTITPPTPTLTALAPTTALAGGPAFDLGVTGTNFMTGAAGAVVVWNGADLATMRDSATHLTAAVPASLIAAAGSASVAVRNGTGPGAPLSPALTFTVANALPLLGSISPTQVWAGYVKNDLTLLVAGDSFVSGAHVTLGSTEKTGTTFVSATQLSVPLLAADVAAPGTINVGVKNPAPGGGLSAATKPLAVLPETSDPAVSIGGADAAWHNAPVALTFSATDGQSGVQAVQYRCPPAVPAWTTESTYTVPVTTQGVIVVSAQALDWCNHVGTASATVKIDTTPPTTDALKAVSVKKGRSVKMQFRITEPAGLSPTAEVVLKVVAASSGRTVKALTIKAAPMNATQTASFRITFKKGAYKWYVYATDLAGNTQANVDSARFTVK